MIHERSETGETPCMLPYLDPLAEDAVGDEAVTTTRRALGRLALVASEAGARFERDRIPVEPMAWMLAPRAVLGGEAPIDACLSLDGCERALIVHRLGLGLDADQGVVDELRDEGIEEEVGDGDDEEDGGSQGAMPDGRGSADRDRSATERGGRRDEGPWSGTAARGPTPRLYTAAMVWSDDVRSMHAFHASVGGSVAEVRTRLCDRFGHTIAGMADIAEGFHDDDAFVEAMVSPAIRDMLGLIASDPGSPLAAGLDLNVEQRFFN